MRDIVVTRTLPYPRQMVWESLTDPVHLADWLMENDFRPETGHEFTFRTDPAPGFDGIVHCRVLIVDEPRRLEMTWRGGPLDTVLAYELEETTAGTVLKLRHSGFKGLGNLMPRIVLGLGWKKNLDKRLGKVLERLAQGAASKAA
jgi:uncharacterized protein YndB with AHSA1/START domain